MQFQTPSQQMVAPVTGNQNLGLMRAEIKQGIRQIIACKDDKGRMGIRVQHVNKGVFVSLVQAGSPAALAGMKKCICSFFLETVNILMLSCENKSQNSLFS